MWIVIRYGISYRISSWIRKFFSNFLLLSVAWLLTLFRRHDQNHFRFRNCYIWVLIFVFSVFSACSDTSIISFSSFSEVMLYDRIQSLAGTILSVWIRWLFRILPFPFATDIPAGTFFTLFPLLLLLLFKLLNQISFFKLLQDFSFYDDFSWMNV